VMVAAMRHASDLVDRSFCFLDGGLASLGRSPHAPCLIWNGDRSVCLALSGHVTGPDLDEAFVNTLRQSPLETLRQLDGSYAFAMYDRTARSLVLAADRFGFVPLYYCHRGDSIVFASEVKAILHVLHSRKLDWDSVADFFYVGHMLGNRTLFHDVHVLDPGEMIIHRRGESRHERYCDFTQIEPLPREKVSTQQVASLFTRAVQKRARKDMRHTVLLSGGMDSRLVLGALKAARITPETITLEHADEYEGADGRLGCQVAESLGLISELRPTRGQPRYLHRKTSSSCFY